MQRLFILLFIFMLTIAAKNCNKKEKSSQVVFKAKLEIKAICMNYTVKLLEGNMDTSSIAGKWTDETTNKTYTRVFALENPCNFPDSIKQGDEFYFIMDTARTKSCMVCLAYYPVPEKKLPIKIINK